MMSWTDILIQETLQELEPTLDLNGVDIRLYQICLEDFKSYLKWLIKESKKNGNGINTFSGEESKEACEFIKIWVGLWWKKYKERVKLQLQSPIPPDNLLLQGINYLKFFTIEEQVGIVEMVTEEFIKNGEICCSKILADSLFKRILGRYSPSKVWTKADKINLVTQLKGEARRIARVHGCLVFIRIDKRYYRLREFRDNGGAPQYL